MMARESYIGLKTFTSDRRRRIIGIKASEFSAFDRLGIEGQSKRDQLVLL